MEYDIHRIERFLQTYATGHTAYQGRARAARRTHRKCEKTSGGKEKPPPARKHISNGALNTLIPADVTPRRDIGSFFIIPWHLVRCRSPPFLTFGFSKCSEKEEKLLAKRYYRKKDPNCETAKTEWIEMSGSEFYRFIRTPESKGRFFIDMDDVVLETTESEARMYKAEKNRRYYIQTKESDLSILSIYTIEDEDGCSGEEVIKDDTEDVEAKAILNAEVKSLQKALAQLDMESYRLIYALYLAKKRKSLRQLSQETGIPVMTLQDRKKKILATLKQKLNNKNF
ncbi:hypothetical protein [Oscillibacter sp.]|uniref:hypothetical protein n=1 Tax=Oscillibacter sp. TaxID=1945593 RepID=UPI001B590996|nr:hypothetical protein [Oscillibacter sp.]MBP3509327.1 sigma-70 family RNA polymerase sigma factor [Oscillibacter sp.]